VDPETLNTLRAAERAVARLVEECRKGGRLYAQDPKAVAQVSRTGRWLLYATDRLRRALDVPSAPGRDQPG
jgi:hypothetical protein